MGTKKNQTPPNIAENTTASPGGQKNEKNGKKMEPVSSTASQGTAVVKNRVSSPLPPSAAAFKLKFSLEDFTGSGFLYKGKLIGTETVNESKGNDIAQETFGILRKRASAAKKHKLRVLVYLSLKGIRVVNEKNATVLMESPINKITYFTRDLGCHRTYGIVVCVTDLQYRFVAIKAERSAEVVVATIQELFDVAALAQKRKSRKERTATMLLLNERAIDVPIEQQQRIKDDLNHQIKYDVTTTAATSSSKGDSSKGLNNNSLIGSSNSRDSMINNWPENKTTNPPSSNPLEIHSTPRAAANDVGAQRPHSVANIREGGGKFKGAFSKLFASSKRVNSMVEIGQLDSAESPATPCDDQLGFKSNKKRGSRPSVSSIESAKSSRSRALTSLRNKKPISESTVDMSGGASEQQENKEPDRQERVFQSSKKGRRSKSGSAKKASRSSRNSQDTSSTAGPPQRPSSLLGNNAIEENLFSVAHSSSPNLNCLLEFEASQVSNGCNKESDLFDPFRKPTKNPQNLNSGATDFDPFSSSIGDVMQQDYSLFNDPKFSADDSALGSGWPCLSETTQTSKSDSKSLGSLNFLDSFGQESMFHFEDQPAEAVENGLDAFGSHIFGGNQAGNELISFGNTTESHETTGNFDQNQIGDGDDDAAFGFKLTSEARDMSREGKRKSRRESTRRTLKSHSMSNLSDDMTFFYSADWAIPNGDDFSGDTLKNGEVFNCFDDVVVSFDNVDDDDEDDDKSSESGSKVLKSRPLHKSVANLDEKFSMRAASVISASFSVSNLSGMSQSHSEKPVLKTLQVIDKPFDDDPFFLS